MKFGKSDPTRIIATPSYTRNYKILFHDISPQSLFRNQFQRRLPINIENNT